MKGNTKSFLNKALVIQLGLVVLFGAMPTIFAQDTVGEQELRSVSPVEFIDFRGRSDVPRTSVQGVMNIGRNLARQLQNANESTVGNKYQVQRYRSPEEIGKYSVDFFYLLSEAKVNTIRDLRYILAGYLEVAYLYNTQDALVLAEFITYYNAHFRDERPAFESKYASSVIAKMQNIAGIDKSYKKWAGATQMLIPMQGENWGGVESFELMNETIQKEMQQLDDKGLSQREAMISLQENQLAQEEEALLGEERALEKQIEQENKNLPANASEQEKQKLQEKQSKQKQEIDKKKKQIEEKKGKLEKNKSKVLQDKLDQSTKQSQDPKAKEKELESLKQDLQNLEKMQNRAEKIDNGQLYFLKKNNYYMGNIQNSTLNRLSISTRKVEVESKLATISGTNFEITDYGIVVIARDDPKSEVHRLVLLDKEKLDILVTSDQVKISPQSIIRNLDGSIVAILEENGKFYLALFNKEMKMTMKSKVAVSETTFVSIFEDKVYVLDPKDRLLILDKSTFEEKESATNK